MPRNRSVVLVGMILVAAASKLIPHPPNFARIPVVDGSFALLVHLGFRLRRRRSVVPITEAALAGSVRLFVFSNFGVWTSDCSYAKTWDGLVVGDVVAIPFFHNTLAREAVYLSVLFGAAWLSPRGVGPCCTNPGSARLGRSSR